MRLEVITELPKKKPSTPPLLFIHGFCHGAWCWENFLPYFAENGYEAHALSLRGHGTSEGHQRIRWTNTAEYVADVAEVVGQLPAPPVLVGHSTGGYVIQKFLETYAAAAAVLLAPVPVTGLGRMLARHAFRHPCQALKLHLTFAPYALVETPLLAREALFSRYRPIPTLEHHYARLQKDSYCAGFQATFSSLPRPANVDPLPLLVLGAENDALFSREEVEATARAYKTEAEFFPNMAHDMMLEPGWGSVAQRILFWLKEHGL